MISKKCSESSGRQRDICINQISGIDLKKYSEELELLLKAAESEAVEQYIEHSPDVVKLHEEMQDCDHVLARMQEMLLGFQADLSGISEEIRHLQDESLSMSVKLKNRREVGFSYLVGPKS